MLPRKSTCIQIRYKCRLYRVSTWSPRFHAGCRNTVWSCYRCCSSLRPSVPVGIGENQNTQSALRSTFALQAKPQSDPLEQQPALVVSNHQTALKCGGTRTTSTIKQQSSSRTYTTTLSASSQNPGCTTNTRFNNARRSCSGTSNCDLWRTNST